MITSNQCYQCYYKLVITITLMTVIASYYNKYNIDDIDY